jgi:diguanylate cyclase (GGDEF)-like protein
LAVRARTSALIIGITALLAMPAWSVFDLLLEPSHAKAFILLRVAGEVPIIAGLLTLHRAAQRCRSALVAVGMLSVVQCEIAWMVVRADDARAFYLLGFSLPLYGCGLLLVAKTRWTLGLIGVTGAALTICVLTGPGSLPGGDLWATSFYLGTASIIGTLAHAQRNRLMRREFEVRGELEQEQLRSHELLQRLERLSNEDSLTGLANRRRWDDALEQACVAAREDDSHVAVLLLDVDLFKQINDRHGHASGDDALRQVSAVAARNVPQGGLVARLGGDELALLLPGLDAYDAAAVAERVRSEVSENVSLDEGKVTVSVSLGVAAERGSAIVATRLMAAADKELYRAKSSRNSVSAPHFSTAGLPTQRTPHEEMRRIRS